MNIYKVSQERTDRNDIYGEAWVCVAENEEAAKLSKEDHWEDIEVYSNVYADFKVEYISTYDGPIKEPHIILVSYPE